MSLLTRGELQGAAKTALEAHPLFTAGRVTVLTNYVAPGEKNSTREAAIRDKGACIEISPVLRERLVTYKRPSLLTKDCTFSVAARISPTCPVGVLPVLPLTLDTMVDAIEAALLGLGFAVATPMDSVEPEQELAHLVEDAEGLLSTAIFFTARAHISAPA